MSLGFFRRWFITKDLSYGILDLIFENLLVVAVLLVGSNYRK